MSQNYLALCWTRVHNTSDGLVLEDVWYWATWQYVNIGRWQAVLTAGKRLAMLAPGLRVSLPLGILAWWGSRGCCAESDYSHVWLTWYQFRRDRAKLRVQVVSSCWWLEIGALTDVGTIVSALVLVDWPGHLDLFSVWGCADKFTLLLLLGWHTLLRRGLDCWSYFHSWVLSCGSLFLI